MGAAHNDHKHGDMDITEHKGTFGGFLKVTEWSSVLIAAFVAMFTFAFAVGLGWWVGLAAFIAIGVLAGLLLNMGPYWWATFLGLTGLLAVGGAITMGIMAFT
jgi:hypothetical protein